MVFPELKKKKKWHGINIINDSIWAEVEKKFRYKSMRNFNLGRILITFFKSISASRLIIEIFQQIKRSIYTSNAPITEFRV